VGASSPVYIFTLFTVMILGIFLLIACIRRPTHPKFTSIVLVIGVILVLMSIPNLAVVDGMILPNVSGIIGIILTIIGLKFRRDKDRKHIITRSEVPRTGHCDLHDRDFDVETGCPDCDIDFHIGFERLWRNA
jgi:hypothetical protein